MQALETWVIEHMAVLEGRYTRKGHAVWVPSPVPRPTHFHLAVPDGVLCIKLVSKGLSVVLRDTLANYQTWGESHGISGFIAGWAKVRVATGTCKWCPHVLRDRALNLKGLCQHQVVSVTVELYSIQFVFRELENWLTGRDQKRTFVLEALWIKTSQLDIIQ